MISLCDIVKVSDEDLLWIMGEGDIEAHVQTLLTKGPKLVCLTEGADGVRGFTKNGIVHVPANRVEVVDTVGAGDTFNAGLLASLQNSGNLTKEAVANLDDETIRDALAMGAAVALLPLLEASGFTTGPGPLTDQAAFTLTAMYAGLPCVLKIAALTLLATTSLEDQPASLKLKEA